MKKILAVAMTAVGCATIASAGVANSISGIHSVKTHYPWDGKVDINYTSIASDGNGYILLDVGPTKRCITLSKTDIEVGNHTKTYDLHEMFGEFKAEVVASVDYVSSQPPDDATGTATGILGDLMTIKLGSATQFEVNTYTNVDLGKFNCDTYKKSKIALLRIPAGRIWPARPGSSSDDTIVTTIAPAKDYWISIFPVTTCQFYNIKDGQPVFDYISPVYRSYDEIRGGVDSNGNILGRVLPTEEVKAGSVMGILAQKTKLNGKFDLPTEMQWEIAARAGSTSPFGHYVKDGKSAEPVMGTPDNLADVAWFFGHGEAGVKDVGQLCPNMWGLYEMFGNVYEWCLDQFEDTVEWKDVETPHYGGISDKRVIRGGWYSSGKGQCRPSFRDSQASNIGSSDGQSNNKGVGFRVCFMPK